MTGYPAFSDRISRKLVAEFFCVKSNINDDDNMNDKPLNFNFTSFSLSFIRNLEFRHLTFWHFAFRQETF